MVGEWILLLGIIMGNQAHTEVIADYGTKEDCINGARTFLADIGEQMRPALYSEVYLMCHNTTPKVKI